MNTFLRVFLLFLIIALAAGFNLGLIDVRMDEIRYLIGKITVDQDITKTFDIVAKYELIKRRMLYGEDDLRNYEIEAKVAALTSGDDVEEDQKTVQQKKMYLLPVRWVLNSLRFVLGKEIINPRDEDQIVKVLQVGYFWERNRTYTEAIKIYTKVLATPGVNADIKAAVMVHAAFCRSMLSEYDVAKDLYEQVINLYPNTEAGMLAWKLLDFIQNMENERKDLQEKQLSDFEKAKQFYLLMDYRNAIKFFSIFLGQPGSDSLKIGARYYKGRSHEELGEVSDATAEYTYIIRNDKARSWARQANRRMLMLGEFYQQKKQLADEARKQLAVYKDESFMGKMEAYTQLVKESSLRQQLMGELKQKQESGKAASSDSILNMINQIGNLDLAGETERKKQEELEQMKQELINKGMLSNAEIKDLERIRVLKENTLRRPIALKKVIDENSSQLKYIYNRRLRAGAKLEGKIQVEIKILPNGTVQSARVLQSNVGDASFEKEVLGCIGKWTFAGIPDSLGSLTVNYPFEFYEEQ
jgi:TonB family protein